MIADEAPSAALMPVVSIVETCATRSATVRAVSVTLRSMRNALRHLDTAEIERQHQRQKHREFDRGYAALVLGELRKPPRQQAGQRKAKCARHDLPH